MGLPSQPVTLNPQEVDALNTKLSTMRHDINNYLSLIVAASELMRYKPQSAEKMMGMLADQPKKITTAISKFTAEFEHTFGITRP
jgi:hypothetical protein